MTEELFRDYWWLIFPVFGMAMWAFGCVREARLEDETLRRARQALKEQG